MRASTSILRCTHARTHAAIFKVPRGSYRLKAHAPGYKSLHFSSSLFSLAFTWEQTCACPCTHTTTGIHLCSINFFTVIMMEFARTWSEGSCWIKKPRHSDKEHTLPSALTPHLLTISLWCIFLMMSCLTTAVFVYLQQRDLSKSKVCTRRQTWTNPRAAFASIRLWNSGQGPKDRWAHGLLWSCICVYCKTSSAGTPVLSETRALALHAFSSHVRSADI